MSRSMSSETDQMKFDIRLSWVSCIWGSGSGWRTGLYQSNFSGVWFCWERKFLSKNLVSRHGLIGLCWFQEPECDRNQSTGGRTWQKERE